MSYSTERLRPHNGHATRRWDLLALTMLAALMGFWSLGAKSFWSDEVFSLQFAGGSLGDVLDRIWNVEINLALHYLILHFWAFLGSGEAFSRALSVVFFVGTVPVAYSLARSLFDLKTARIAGTLVAINGFAIQWGQQVRGYSLLMFLMTVSTYAFVQFIDRPDRRRWVAVYLISSLFGVYTHFFAALVWLAHAITLSLLPPDKRRPVFSALTIGYAFLALASVPLGFFVLTHGSGQIEWLSRPNLLDAADAFGAISGKGGKILSSVAFALSGSFGVLSIRRLVRDRRSGEAWRSLLVLQWIAVPLVVSLALSLTVIPVFQDRYLIVSLPALAIAIAHVLTLVNPRWLAHTALAVVLVLSLRGAVDWYRQPPFQDWPAAVSALAMGFDERDIILISPHHLRAVFGYYVSTSGVDENLQQRTFFSSNEYLDPRPLRYDEQVSIGLEEVAQSNRVWFVTRTTEPALDLTVFLTAAFPAAETTEVSGLTITEFTR